MRAARVAALLLAGIRPRGLAVGGGITAGLVLCLAVPGALAAVGCLEIGILGACPGVNGTAMAAVQPVVVLVPVVLAGSFLASFAFEGVRHSRVARALSDFARPASLKGQKVGLVSEMSGAVVAGVARPAIYCSPALIARLEDEELEAVILHELHHQQTWAPLRLVILAAAGRFVDWSAAGRRWRVRQQAAIEIAADAHVLSAGLPRAVLARAIVKLSDAYSGVGAAAFATAADLRLRALLDEEPRAAGPDRGRMLAIAGLIAFLVACTALA